MPEPTERALWLVAAIAALGVVSAAVPLLDAAAPVALAGFIVALVIDGVWAGSPRRVQVQRVLPERAVAGTAPQCHYVIESPADCWVELTDTLQAPGVPWLEHRVRAPAGRPLTLPFVPPLLIRGRYPFGPLAVRTCGPLGLMRRRERRVLDDTLSIGIDLLTLQKAAQSMLLSQAGAGRARRLKGRGREFDSLREYHRGDDVRQVAWKASARRGHLVVKNTRPEQRQDVWLMVDAGRQMLGAADTLSSRTRLDVSVDAALSTAAAVLSSGDAAGAVVFGADVQVQHAPRTEMHHLRTLGAAVAPLQARPEQSQYHRASERIVRVQRRRALIILVTDVVDVPQARAVAAVVTRLRGRHVTVVCALGDPESVRLQHHADPIIAQAARDTLAHRRRALAAVAAAGAMVVDSTPDRCAADLIAAYAEVKATGRL